MTTVSPDIEEIIDLELLLSLSPVCEDDHQWVDGPGLLPAPVPPCGVEATHLLLITCADGIVEQQRELICTPLAKWLSGQAQCVAHGRHAHAKIIAL